MTIDFQKHKIKYDKAQSKAQELNNYILENCGHSDEMTSLIEDPSFQKELVKTLTETSKTDD